MTRFKKHLSPLTVTGALLIIAHIFMLLVNYQELARGEGWGVVYVVGVLFWSCIMIGVGLLIKLIFKNKISGIIIDSLVLLVVIISVIAQYK